MHNTSHSAMENNSELQFIEHSLNTSLQLFKEYYAKKQFDEAFEQLQFILSIIESCNKPELITEALICCVKFASLVSVIPESDILIQSIIASLHPDTSPENLSMSYYLLSVQSIEMKNVTEAIQYAKSAYFHALEIPGDRLFYECNAQLQLVSSLLEAGNLIDAEIYIKQFNWYIENCKNDIDIVFVNSIQASTNFLKQNYEIAIFAMSSLLKRFNESNEIMYTSFLARHFFRIINLHPDAKLLYGDLLVLCETIKNRHNQFLPTDLNLPQQVVLLNSNQFYKRSNEFFDHHFEKKNTIIMTKYKFNGSMNLNKLLNMINYEASRDQLIIYPYCEQKFLLITTEGYIKHLETNIITKNNVTNIASSTNIQQTNFYDLYNELNLQIISQL